ncbi:MAG: lamin tail domain-containing protein, partial [Bacteroidota bacterium]
MKENTQYLPIHQIDWPMKKCLLTIFCSLGLLGHTAAQLVINEIFYNSPDGGADSIEFIELYNNSAIFLNLEGYSFTEGINYTFPNVDIAAGAYLLIANDSLAMLNNFGTTAYEWTSGALNNSGEDIELVDAQGTVIDYVDYSEALPWPAAADGDGPSLELCDPQRDNSDAAAWGVSTNSTNVILNGTIILATPGSDNTYTCPEADAEVTISNFLFDPADITITVGQTVKWSNTEGNHNVNGTQNTFPNNPESFLSGPVSPAPWEYFHTFNTVGTYDYQCDQHVNLGMVGTVTVLPAPPNDLVITEMMYNIPGVDNNFDFIELYNRGTQSINLVGYRFIEGVDLTFGAISLAPGDYLVVCEDASAFNSTFGITALSWEAGGLNDNGEDIVLVDPNGVVVDNVTYDDDAPWAEIADGEGPSLILCDLDADNDVAENWGFSTNNTGIVSGGSGNLIYASPGAPNGPCASNPHLFFENGLEDVDEGDLSVDIRLLLANVGNNDTVDVEL